MKRVTLDQMLNTFRAAGEETRLRIALLLARGELTVTELTQILSQSQPRVSRHLKILSDSGLVERYREGAWVFYRLPPSDSEAPGVSAVRGALEDLEKSGDRLVERDLERLRQVRQSRAEAAAAYFKENAAQWDELRRLHLPEADIEAAMRETLGPERVDTFLDLGVGTGRVLTVFADRYAHGVGYDLSREMLSVARANLDAAGVEHAQVRLGDLNALPVEGDSADVVCIHQVLHYLDDPSAAVVEAARVLAPGGRLLIVDFAPHALEFLRDSHAHRRLGFADEEVRAWCAEAGLDFVREAALAPKQGETDRLTVKIWLCARRKAANRPARSRTTAAE